MTKNLKKSTVSILDVGVLVLAFNRPEMLVKRIEELSNNKICNLYISIDGGSESHNPEMESEKNFARQAFQKIENFSLKHHKKNLGVDKHTTQEISKVLMNHQYVIIIEDDVKVTGNFIENMVNGINIQNQLGINGIISGWSPLYAKKPNNKWRTTTYPFVWGWACSSKIWDEFAYDLSKTNIESQLLCSQKWHKLSNHNKNKYLLMFKKFQLNPQDTWDVPFLFLFFRKNYISLCPVFSIVGNEGFDDKRATHTKGKIPRTIMNNKLNNSVLSKLSVYSIIYKIADQVYANDVRIVRKFINFFKLTCPTVTNKRSKKHNY
jgi:hypothetical protein